jgi:hypothetical protein
MEKQLKRVFSAAIRKRNRISFNCFVKECPEKAIDSHSQSLANALKKIAENGHIITPMLPHFINGNKDINSCFQKIGVKRASTFKGFCSKHDNEYFTTVDSIDLQNITKETLTRLAFRTFSYEQRTKEKMLFFSNYIIAYVDNLPNLIPIKANAMGIRNHLEVTKPYYLNKFIAMFESQNYDQIHGIVFVLDKMLPLSCSTVIDPTMINSNSLIEHDIRTPLNQVFLNLIPQSDSSLVVFTCFREQKVLLRKFIDELKSLETIIFNHCEEILLNPSFCVSLSNEIKYQIVKGLRGWASWEREDFPDLFNIELKSPLFV